MDEDFHNQLINSFNLRSTDELLEIWTLNDRVEWTDDAFKAIQEILLDRLGSIPLQNPPIIKYVVKKKSPKEFILGLNPIGLQFAFMGVLLLTLEIMGNDYLKYPFFTTILLIFALGLLGLSGVIIIIRKEYPKPGFSPVKGVLAVIGGVFILVTTLLFAWFLFTFLF